MKFVGVVNLYSAKMTRVSGDIEVPISGKILEAQMRSESEDRD